MASFKFKRKAPRAKDALCPIVLVYNYNRSKRSEISTGIFVQRKIGMKKGTIQTKTPRFYYKK